MRALFLLSLALGFSSYAEASDWSTVTYLPARPPMTVASPDPVYLGIFRSVDQEKLQTVLKQMTGVIPVTLNGQSYSLSERYSPDGKAKFRAFWRNYFANLGIPAQELSYNTRHHIGEMQGHNLEAVLPGKSKNSVVIIVHYDSIGPWGRETQNPGVDDDMTGMAILMETARILAPYKGKLQNTIRFVAADYEEHSGPGLEGARQYATYIKAKATQEGFSLVAAVDNEQTGWNCSNENACDPGNKTFDVFSCSGDAKRFDSPALGDSLASIAAQYSDLQVERGCMSEHSDHYAMWEIGVPAVVFSEHNPFDNPHFDQNGGDTYDKIDQTYFFKIAQVGVTFAAQLTGVPSSRLLN